MWCYSNTANAQVCPGSRRHKFLPQLGLLSVCAESGTVRIFHSERLSNDDIQWGVFFCTSLFKRVAFLVIE